MDTENHQLTDDRDGFPIEIGDFRCLPAGCPQPFGLSSHDLQIRPPGDWDLSVLIGFRSGWRHPVLSEMWRSMGI